MKTIMFPGQGSQYKGMGKKLFKDFKSETLRASEILGYDLEELCVHDPEKQLKKTQFTQPALYVVNAFQYFQKVNGNKPDFLIGHSLGEYNALLAAEVFDFEEGLSLVKERGKLMAAASGGGMAAVLGVDVETLQAKLKEGNYDDIDIANYNTPSQIVISGQQEEINKVVKDFTKQKIKIIPLFVSAPFHSRYMQPAADEFAGFLKKFDFKAPKISVISNVTAQPYQSDKIAGLLSEQISNSVKWIDTIRFLMGQKVAEYQEIGSVILTKMVNEIKESCDPIITKNGKPSIAVVNNTPAPETFATKLGNKDFRADYNIKYAYLTGAMYRGIASKELVIRMAKANMFGFLGTGGMPLNAIEENIQAIQKSLKAGESYGMNLLHNPMEQEMEMKTVKLYLDYNIQHIEASGFMQMTKALVYYRAKGLEKDKDGNLICKHKILAKISRPEVAEVFMRPAPTKLIDKLLEDRLLTQEEAELVKLVPVSHDICVEADSGGHTDRGIGMVLLPAIQSLKKQIESEYHYEKSIRVGLAGGIGTPQAAACAFIMGADFILTGSINQCTVEAGTSDVVKNLLEDINVQDTDYAPAGDMFEIGAKVQVLKKGVLFSARANKLYGLYTQYNSLDEIPEKTIARLEKNYFKKPLSDIWEETKNYFINKGEHALIERAEKSPKNKMALVFRWYFGYSNRMAFEGNLDHKVNFQVHTGPALGAFNQWVKGTKLESWKNRHVDEIGEKLMEEAGKILESSLTNIAN